MCLTVRCDNAGAVEISTGNYFFAVAVRQIPYNPVLIGCRQKRYASSRNIQNLNRTTLHIATAVDNKCNVLPRGVRHANHCQRAIGTSNDINSGFLLIAANREIVKITLRFNIPVFIKRVITYITFVVFVIVAFGQCKGTLKNTVYDGSRFRKQQRTEEM